MDSESFKQMGSPFAQGVSDVILCGHCHQEPVGSDAKVVADGGTSNQKGFQGILPGMIAQT